MNQQSTPEARRLYYELKKQGVPACLEKGMVTNI